MSFAPGSSRPGGVRCGNNPSKIAVGFCPDLDTPLCQESFDMLKSQPALRHITLVGLHKMDEKRRRDPETQEPYTLYDTVLQKPIPTVAKLVGASKEHEVISLEEAANQTRDDLRMRIRQLSDQISSVRVAQSQVEKLIFAITHSCTQTKDEVEAYFGEFHERLERRRKEVLREVQVQVDTKLGPLRVLSENLPVIREKAHAATDKANEVLTCADTELLFRRKEVEVMMSAAELRFDCSPDWINDAKGALRFECDDRYLFLEQSCKIHSQKRDPELEKAVSLVATLLGQHPGEDVRDSQFASAPERDFFSAPDSRARLDPVNSRSVRFDNAKQPLQGSAPAGPSSGWQTFSDTGAQNRSSPFLDNLESTAHEDRRPDLGRSAFGLLPDRVERSDHRRDAEELPLRPQVFTFDQNYMEPTLQISPDGRTLTRRSPKASSALCCTKQLLPLGERIDFSVEELNLYLPGSGWIGVTPVRSLSSLQESALYLDLSTGAIMNNDSQVCVANDGEFSLCEGDVISIVLHTDRSLTFYVNRQPLSRAITNCPDLVYPFANVNGKVIKLALTD